VHGYQLNAASLMALNTFFSRVVVLFQEVCNSSYQWQCENITDNGIDCSLATACQVPDHTKDYKSGMRLLSDAQDVSGPNV
jgi:hypothetical protein